MHIGADYCGGCWWKRGPIVRRTPEPLSQQPSVPTVLLRLVVVLRPCDTQRASRRRMQSQGARPRCACVAAAGGPACPKARCFRVGTR